jgi:hypothetical protein
MQEKQIFKPFAEFEEGEFDKVFKYWDRRINREAYRFCPKLCNAHDMYYILEIGGNVFTIIYRDNWGFDPLYNLPTHKICFKEKDFIGFPSLELAYEALRGELIRLFKKAKSELGGAIIVSKMSFADFVQSENIQAILTEMYNNEKNKAVWLGKSLSSAAEQFPNA